MKRLSQALLAFFLITGIQAELQGPNQCVDINGASQVQSTSEVVVWVNEDGDAIRTETNHLPASTEIQDKPPATISQVPVSTHEPETVRLLSTKTETRIETVTQQLPAATEIKKSVQDHLDAHVHPPAAPPVPGPAPPPPPPPPPPPHPEEPLLLPPDPQPVPHTKPHHHPHPHPHPDSPVKKRDFGISYSPYKADRSCKNQDEVNKDLDRLSDHSYIRIYGTDCDQTKTVATAARKHKMQVFAGVYDLSDFPHSLDAFEDAIRTPDGKTDWSVFHTIAVGNELVNGGTADPGEVAGAVNQARTILRGKGYRGAVVTVDTFSVHLKHPELCEASDYCAANCHAFFDANQQAHNAGPYALEQAHSVSNVAGGKRTIITESGWPHAGESNGAAVPSQENQRVAIESLRRSFAHRKDDLVLFTAFDDMWKDDNRYTFNAERFWGIYDK